MNNHHRAEITRSILPTILLAAVLFTPLGVIAAGPGSTTPPVTTTAPYCGGTAATSAGQGSVTSQQPPGVLCLFFGSISLAAEGELLAVCAPAQDVSYAYDPVGNVARVVDAAASVAGKTVNYAYDPLNRLLTAASTLAGNGQNYSQSFTYDAIGNILAGPAGAYLYQGSQGASYANPHAAT